jgi:hydrogenase maturation protein HypF
MEVRKLIEVSGIVQGVGFRPYVYRLATERRLAGNISNTPAGVTIEVQGAPAAVDDFLERLPAEVPSLARVTGIGVRELPCNDESEFHILASRKGDPVRTLISPDVAVCSDCLRELFDPMDRRYKYPFINCTNCGPRFTIVRDIPYDRPGTSMAVFPMCEECQAEYDDPRNRRFHAQPNACWRCGPQMELWDARGRRVSEADAIMAAAERLKAGEVVAVKGLGGFHLAADATNAAALATLRERKRRVEKPFAVMVRDLDAAARYCRVDAEARGLLQTVERPIVLLPWQKPSELAPAVAPFNRYLGVFLPYTPIHHLLFAAGLRALVMTSGNLSEEPIAIDNREAVERLHGVADWFLVHNRDILLRCDDSVVRPTGGRPASLRRSRGFVPVPILLSREVPEILAVGGELKNTLCLTQGRQAFLSQHVGDLENLESYKFFEEAARHLRRILQIEPRVLAYDLHPDYFSTRWALRQPDVPKVGVQHHHAHIAACMAENGLDGQVIGIALDGTGYGADGNVWGGEVLIAGYDGFVRAAHLAYTHMPGSAAAIRNPWRMAVSHLARHFGSDFLCLDIPFVRNLPRRETQVLLRMIEAGTNSPLTSSCGRLFDAVAALIGLRSEVNYEGQAAIELEMAIDSSSDSGHYPMAVIDDGSLVLDPGPLLEAIVEDLRRGVGRDVISRRFHLGLVNVLSDVAARLRRRTGLDRVCLSGGTFQNVFLLEHLMASLAAQGLSVYRHFEVPTADGGLCLGQALVAANRTA